MAYCNLIDGFVTITCSISRGEVRLYNMLIDCYIILNRFLIWQWKWWRDQRFTKSMYTLQTFLYWASSWLTWLEHRFRACVVRNVPGSSPHNPHNFYQRRLPCTVFFLSIGSSHRSLAYRDGKNLKKDCPYFLFEKYIKQNLFRVKAKRLVLIFVSFESDSQKRNIWFKRTRNWYNKYLQ